MGTALVTIWAVLGMIGYVLLFVGVLTKGGGAKAGFGCLSLALGPVLIAMGPLVLVVLGVQLYKNLERKG